jgi:hypothetical protein
MKRAMRVTLMAALAGRLRGGDPFDIYYFGRNAWGRDIIVETSPSRNTLRLLDDESFGGALTARWCLSTSA